MEVDPRETRERYREVGPDQLAQRVEVALRLDVEALILDLGVDHEAIGTVVNRCRPGLCLENRMYAVDVLPCARVHVRPVQCCDDRRIEL